MRAAGEGRLADQVHRLVVRELAASTAGEAPAVIRRAVDAPAAPTPAPRVPAPRADRPAELPVRTPAPVDVGRLTEAVSRRLARRGAVDDERRGMGR